MNEMVERVALVICQEDGYETMDSPLEYTGSSGREHWLEVARAAIAAMREPTEEMVNAFYDEIYESAESKWYAMINEALAKAPSPAS